MVRVEVKAGVINSGLLLVLLARTLGAPAGARHVPNLAGRELDAVGVRVRVA